MTDKLLPCPFCGGSAYIDGSEKDGFYASCSDCYCCIGEAYDRSAMPEHMFRSEADAVEQWNRRTPSPKTNVEGWLELSDEAKDAGRILLLWKPFGGVKEHIELGRWDKVKLVWVNTYGHKFSNDPDLWSPLAPYNPWGHVPCPCTTFEQDEDCPQGAPSLLCAACSGTGNATQDTVVALAAEMLKVAEQVDELEDPFAAWESIDLLKSQNDQLRALAAPASEGGRDE